MSLTRNLLLLLLYLLLGFHSAVDLLPVFVGSVTPNNNNNASLEWKGACFKGNEARLDITVSDRDEPGLGGGFSISRITWDYYFSARDHTLSFGSWEETAELDYVKEHGVSVFLMPSGMLGTLLSLIDNANLAFLTKHMGATFEKRPQPWRSTINPEDVHSGDFLAVSKIRGRWGGFETLEKWVTGAFAGHTAVCLKDDFGRLWVGESGHENEKGEEIIVVIPWDEWWDLTLKDSSNPQVALLPLHPDIRAKFNNTAAWEYARSMLGKPYGYHNMIFSWIDTLADNYPPPLMLTCKHWEFQVISVMSMWTRVQPAYAANMWNEALNKRLGTKELDLYGILEETARRGMSFDELLTIPEQDEWVYSDGNQQHALLSSLQCTKPLIRDAYTLRMFEDNQTRLPSWCNTEKGKLEFCQILGEYRMELPGYNTIDPYPNMNENCPSLPSDYERPSKC
ncbi:hypothetical protein Bca52824_097140 [Brassica carinata]|uniref:Uncharacterized protein n=1 Tax=Brassica carinata TaxID=52824 RepID=A0A8X7TFZ6_BRACI|nr:hypothetical protein Bca52824_097140 [Brassica carinata]